jgi:hypothetical protein
MTTLREAALMALKALEFGHLPVADQAKHRDVMSYIEAMDVLRKALDADSMASLPEPVAWSYEVSTTMTDHGYDGWEHRITKYKPNVPEGSIRSLTPLYTAPPQRKPLSEGKIGRLCGKFDVRHSVAIGIARAVEQAHGIGENA